MHRTVASLVLYCALAISANAADRLYPAPEIHPVQNITISFLERMLDDLIASGEEPDTATICTVDWAQYGIIVSLNCKAPAGPNKQDTTPTLNGPPRFDCAIATEDNREFCIERELEIYGANLAAPWEVSATQICSAIIESLHLDEDLVRPPCPGDNEFSELKLRDQPDSGSRRGLTGEPFLYIHVEKDGSEPPIYNITLVGTPRALDDMNATEHYERIDFLLFWTYEMNGEFDVAVEPLLVLQGTNSSTIDELIRIRASDRMATKVFMVRQTQSRPNVVASSIAAQIRALTVAVRDTLQIDER
ncbi:MAG: hypothetical protein AAGL89_18570 [Pseudomonadota bacterium]